jgi:hypothetical protein
MFNYGVTQHAAAPGPEAPVQVRSLYADGTREAIAVVDSGAVQSCVPLTIVTDLDEIERAIRKPIEVHGATGHVIETEAALLRVSLGDLDLGRLWVVVIDRRYMLLGRDVLNRHCVVLDGPKKVWRIEHAD